VPFEGYIKKFFLEISDNGDRGHQFDKRDHLLFFTLRGWLCRFHDNFFANLSLPNEYTDYNKLMFESSLNFVQIISYDPLKNDSNSGNKSFGRVEIAEIQLLISAVFYNFAGT